MSKLSSTPICPYPFINANELIHFNLKKLTKKEEVNVTTSSEFTQNSQKPKNAKARRETTGGNTKPVMNKE
jgi:hypothetical protein